MKQKPRRIPFFKMHGAGNDYIFIDCFRRKIARPAALARKISDRRAGAGSDGLILICPPRSKAADAEMRMYNADGSRSAMCANGLRCVARYLRDAGYARSPGIVIESGGRTCTARTRPRSKLVSLDLGVPEFAVRRIPVRLPGPEAVDIPLRVGGRSLAITCVSIGNPHCVVFVPEATDALVLRTGPLIERHRLFPERVNVEFVEIVTRTLLRQRTWERGTGETASCGSGAAAACVAAARTGRADRKVKIEMTGGTLAVNWRRTDGHIVQTGPAEYVYRGEWPFD